MLRILLLTLALVMSACGTADLVQVVSEQADPVEVNLSDTDQMALLGSPEPASVKWQRTVAGYTVLGQTAAPDQHELDVLETALRSLPPALPIQVRYIVRAKTARGLVDGDPFAAAQGPDIYLFDDSFARDASPVFSLRRALIHELVHVEQFADLDPSHVGALLAGQQTKVSLTNSAALKEFAQATGWTSGAGEWEAPSETSNEYGATSPTEDMAESVAMSFSGEEDLLPKTHFRAVTDWLGTSSTAPLARTPWIPRGSEQVALQSDIHNTAIIAEMAAGGQVDIISFTLAEDSPNAKGLVGQIESSLRQRQLSGSLDSANDPAIARFEGSFTAPDGTRMWVELHDFRDAPGFSGGPSAPVLIYAMIWP